MPRERLALNKFRLNAYPDVPDFRDWIYRPTLRKLKKEIEPPSRAGAATNGGCPLLQGIRSVRSDSPRDSARGCR